MLWFFFTAALASTTISAPSSQDAAVAKWDADRRFGGETAARLTKGAYSGAQIGSPNAASTTFLVQFDLPLTIGESMGSVESAAVRFTLAGDIEPGVKLRAYRLTEGFDDDPTSGVNWATRPAADSTPAVMWTSAGASAGDTIEVDVSALLAQNGAMPTFGLVFELASPWEHSTDTLHTYAFAYAREDGVGAPAHLSAEVAIRTGGWTDDLSAGGDAQINQRDVNSGVNYGAADQVWMSSHADATYEGPAHPSEFMNVGLIDFPLVGAHDAVYADAESAMLNLHAAGELPEGTAIVIRLLDAPFDEGSVTWNSRPTRLSVPTATWIAPAGGVQAGEPFQVDVLELVLANPQSNNFGLQLERYDGAGYVWATKESMSWPGPTLRVSTEPTFDAYIDHPSGLVQRGTPLSLEVELDGLCPEDEAERIRVMAIDELGLVRGTGSLPVGPISWPSDPQTGLPTCPEGGESVRRSRGPSHHKAWCLSGPRGPWRASGRGRCRVASRRLGEFCRRVRSSSASFYVQYPPRAGVLWGSRRMDGPVDRLLGAHGLSVDHRLAGVPMERARRGLRATCVGLVPSGPPARLANDAIGNLVGRLRASDAVRHLQRIHGREHLCVLGHR